MKIICIEIRKATPQQTFDGAASSPRVLIPAHLIGPVEETSTGCTIYLSGGFPAIQSAEPYDDIITKLNKMNDL